MTQAVGHRGPQPPNYVSSSARPKAGSKQATRPQSKTNANAVKFGGVGQNLLNGSVGTFQNITEVFLAGFLAQDVFAMWLPRVWTSLQEGREAYDPTQDPNMKDKPFGEQMRAWATGNAQGLNWVNFFEGTKREAATGPGLLAVPALAFMLNRAVANPSIELSHSSLKGMGAGLKAHLKQNPSGKGVLTEQVKEYLKNTFADINHVVDNAKVRDDKWKMARETKALISKWVDAEVDESVKLAELPGHKRWWENARQVFGKAPLRETTNPNLPPEQKLSTLRKNVEDAIWDFNREHRINGYDELHGIIKDITPLNNTAKTWHTYEPAELKKSVERLSVLTDKQAKKVGADAARGKLLKQAGFGQIKNDMGRVGGFINKIWENHAKDTSKPMGEVVDHTMKGLIGQKWMFGTGVTVLTAAYLVKLAFWAQNHGTYQATRLLNDDAAKSKNKNKNQTQKGSERSHGSDSANANAQLQAGLPFGSQPAFLRLRATTPNRSPFNPGGSGFVSSPLNQPAFNQPILNNRLAQGQPVWFRGQQAEGGQA